MANPARFNFGEAMVGNWRGAGLLKESVFKPVLTTIEQGLVLRIMGQLAAADVKSLREVLAEVVASGVGMPRWAASRQDAAETAKSGAACSFASTGAGVEHGVLGKVIQFTYSAYSYANQEAAMQTISATDLARNTREVLDKVVTGGEVVAIERNHALIAQIGPADRTMTATQALAGLPLPILTAAQGAAWLEDSLQGFDDAVPNPWA